MMVGRDVKFAVDKTPAKPGKTVLKVQDLVVKSKLHKKNAVDGVSIHVNAGEIVCIAGIAAVIRISSVTCITVVSIICLRL